MPDAPSMVVYVACLLSCCITLGNVLVAWWEAKRTQARFDALEEQIAYLDKYKANSEVPLSKRS